MSSRADTWPDLVVPPRRRPSSLPVAVLTDDAHLRAVAAAAVAAVPGLAVAVFSSDAVAAAVTSARAVVVGGDCLPSAVEVLRGRPAGVRLAVLSVADDPAVWPQALDVRAEEVMVPGVRGDLGGWLSSLASVARPGALGVVGGRGGAGATTAAVALARAAAATGAAVLVDADPLGGGVDLALGAEGVAGLRWPDLTDVSAAPAHRWLLAALPAADGVSVLSHARHGPRPVPDAAAPQLMARILDACLASAATVVVDLPRHPDPVAMTALSRCQVLVVVVPLEVRAAAAAAAVVDIVADGPADVRLLVRGPSPTGLSAEDVAASLGVASFVEVRPEPGVAARLDRGDPVAAGARSPLRRWAEALLASGVSR